MSRFGAAGTSVTPSAVLPTGTVDPAPTRRGPWAELIAVALAVAIAAVVGMATYRHLHSPGRPVLPTAWCRVGSFDTLPPLLGSALLTKWQLDPIALVVLAGLAAWYLGAVGSARRHGQRWPLRRTVCFLAGLLVAGLATNSSIAVYDMALFSAHMMGHLMLVMIAPVLLCAGQPLTLLLAACAQRWRDRISRRLLGPVATALFCPPVALICYVCAIVGTHLTGLMDSIMLHPWAGQLEHLVYLLVGCQFFMLITAGDPPIRWRLTTPARWLLLVLSMAVDTFTGVVILFQSRPVAMMSVPGLAVNRTTDTQTGAAIMWVGGDGLMAVVMIGLVFNWLRSPAMRDRDRGGYMEQARRSTFTEHTGAAAPESQATTFDDDDEKLAQYNAWLARINARSR